MDRFAYDVERMLAQALDHLKYELISENCDERRKAQKAAAEIMQWLFAAREPLTFEEKLESLDALDRQLTAEERSVAAQKAFRSRYRRVGRPADGSRQRAIRAYAMQLMHGMSYRQLAFNLKGCDHLGRNEAKSRSCSACGEAMRASIGRLKRLLDKYGIKPDVPGRVRRY